MARSLGYDVTVVDPRTAFASAERFPDVPLVAEWPDVALPPLNVDHYTAFVAVTHDPKIDDPALLHAFERNCFYIGALGSRKTHAKRAERLRAQGAKETDIARIHAPIGLADRRGVAVGDRGLDHGGDHRAVAAARKRKRRCGMKFGPASPAEAIGGVTVHTLRQGSLVLKKGTTDRRGRGRGAEKGGRQGNRRGAAGGGRRLRGRRGGLRSRRPSRAKASMSSAPSPAVPICLPPARACW